MTDAASNQSSESEAVTASELAALIDGTLDPIQRARVLESLAASPELMAVYHDAIAALAETDRDVRPITTLRNAPTRRSRWQLALPVAAAAVLVLAVGLVVQRRARAPQPLGSAVETVALLSPRNRSHPLPSTSWVAVRGSADASTERANAIHIGAALVLLQLQRDAHDSTVRTTLESLASRFDAMPAASLAAQTFRQLASLPLDSLSADRVTAASALAERFLSPSDARTGAWLYALTVATAECDLAFIQAGATASAMATLTNIASTATELRTPTAQLGATLTATPVDCLAISARANELLITLTR